MTGQITLRDLAAIDVEVLKGVGEKRKAALAEYGINNVLELLMNYPRKWVDRTNEARVSDLVAGQEALVIVEVRKVSKFTTKNRKTIVNVQVGDESGRLTAVFFNQPWRDRQLKAGLQVAMFGKPDLYRGVLQMSNPLVDLIDPLPNDLRERLELAERTSALWSIHFPDSMVDKQNARRRLAFDELLRVQVVLVGRKRAFELDNTGIRHKVGGKLQQRFIAALPFAITNAQQRVINEIDQDLAAPHPMHRLLQGDVGSGKTVVAVSAMLAAVQGRHQGALMAPTEVLAEQHFAGVKKLLEGLSVPDENNLFGDRQLRVELLTSRITSERRRELLRDLANGGIDILIGTHALIQEGVEFASLGVVVIDEQHRFGVEQRAALTVSGDLDVSVLDEMPPGRTPIKTAWVAGEKSEAKMWADIREAISQGQQAFVVCPLIEESDKLQVASAEDTFKLLAKTELKGLKLGLLHGRMSSSEKDETMSEFRDRKLDVLVATTVIEVGVDVPNATCMVVLDADRFGIAQLHQLRGRVGRGVIASRCWLVTSDPEVSSPRVDALVESTDGFYLAEVDLELRGEGTIMNTAQKGRSDLKLASLRRDRDLIELARTAATELIISDPTLTSHKEIRDEIDLLLTPDEEEFLFKN